MTAKPLLGSERPGPAEAPDSPTQPPRIPRPPIPERDVQMSRPEPSLLGPLPSLVKRAALGAVDRGWFGLTPLDTHVVICGFPRSGSTLLLLIAETCIAEARVFGREVRALRMARHAWRNHPVMISKRPMDIYWADDIREYYARRHVRLRFVVTTRDPRAILTSFHHTTGEGRYYVTPAHWRSFWDHYRYNRQFDDVIIVDFAELVTAPRRVEQRLAQFTGWKVQRPFDRFYEFVDPGRFRTANLNGLRPFDQDAIDKWRQPRHRNRIRALLDEMADLPDILIEMGYEPDTRWTQEYR